MAESGRALARAQTSREPARRVRRSYIVRAVTPSSFLDSFVLQLERERHAFVWRNALYVAGNLVLAGFVWNRSSGAALWVPAAVAFLGNVYHVLAMEWEHRGAAVWRRELPRLQSRLGGDVGAEMVLVDPGQARLRRWLKWTAWGLTVAWLVVLLLAIRASGLDFRLGS